MLFESISLWRSSSYQWGVSLLAHSIKHLVVRAKPQHMYHYLSYLREHIIMTSPIYVMFKVFLRILLIIFCLSHEYMVFEQLIFPSFDDCLQSLTLHLPLHVVNKCEHYFKALCLSAESVLEAERMHSVGDYLGIQ